MIGFFGDFEVFALAFPLLQFWHRCLLVAQRNGEDPPLLPLSSFLAWDPLKHKSALADHAPCVYTCQNHVKGAEFLRLFSHVSHIIGASFLMKIQETQKFNI